MVRIVRPRCRSDASRRAEVNQPGPAGRRGRTGTAASAESSTSSISGWLGKPPTRIGSRLRLRKSPESPVRLPPKPRAQVSFEAATSRTSAPPPESFPHQKRTPAGAGERGPAPHQGPSAPDRQRVSAWRKRQQRRRCCGGHRHSIWRRGPALPAPARSLDWRIHASAVPSLACRRRPRSTRPAALRGCATWGRADSKQGVGFIQHRG